MKLIKIENAGSIANVKYLLGMVHKSCKGRIAFAIISNLLNKICDIILFIYFIQYIFESVEYGGSFQTLLKYLTILALVEILIKTILEFYYYYARVTDPQVYRYIYGKVINKASNMPLYSFENPVYYDEYQKAMDEARTNASLTITNLSEVIGQIFGIIVLAILIIRNDPVVLIFSVIPVVIVSILNRVMSDIFYIRKNALVKDQRCVDYCKRLFYEKKYANEIRVYPIRHMFFDMHEKAYGRIKKILWSYSKKIIGIEISYKLMIHISILVVSSIYITYQVVNKNRMSAGAYASLLVAVYQMGSSIRNLMSSYTELLNNGKSARNLIRFLEDEADKIDDGQDGLRITEPFRKLTFQKVSYSYYGSNKKALDQINFSIAKGEKLALVGYNGAGKTTLVKLLMGLYDTTEGTIYYNSYNINKLNKSDYKKHFSVIFQDYQLYALPISTNILMKKVENSEDRDIVKAALENVGMINKIQELEQGIETCLTHEFDQNGLLLSGGESQKIAIARVFAKREADIIILDEPSSALDPVSEFEIYQNIMKVFEDKTVIFISHRLSTAKIANRILMFENGRIIEQGTHDELMRNKGEYAKMFRVQAMKYSDDLETDTIMEKESVG